MTLAAPAAGRLAYSLAMPTKSSVSAMRITPDPTASKPVGEAVL
jgi:hypothetical protein